MTKTQFYQAVCDNHLELVERTMMEFTQMDRSIALAEAAGDGLLSMVELLIPVSDPTYQHSQALRFAAENNHLECVRALISVSDPKSQNSAAIVAMLHHTNQEGVDLLFDVSDPQALLDSQQTVQWAMMARQNNNFDLKGIIERAEAAAERDRLMKGIGEQKSASEKRKI